MRISEAAKAGVKSRADLAGLSVTGYMEREYGSPWAAAQTVPALGVDGAVERLIDGMLSSPIGVPESGFRGSSLASLVAASRPEGAAPAPAAPAAAPTPPALAAFNDGFDTALPAGLEGHALTAPVAASPALTVPEKVCGCGGRNGNPAPYRTSSRLHSITCPFYGAGA